MPARLPSPAPAVAAGVAQTRGPLVRTVDRDRHGAVRVVGDRLPWLFPEAVERRRFAATVGSNPALGLIFGPAYDPSTVDGFNAWRSLSIGGSLTASASSSSS